MIVPYKKSHEEEIQLQMLKDVEWASLCGVKWLFTEDECAFRSYATVYIEDSNVVWLCSCSVWNIPQVVCLDRLYVFSEYRGKWIWKAFLNDIETYYKKLNMKTIRVCVYDKWNVWFYRKLWFVDWWYDEWWWVGDKQLFLYKPIA